MNVEICNVCNGEIPIRDSYPKTLYSHSCPLRQAPEFYADGDSRGIWEEDGNPFFVRVVGEMVIHVTDEHGNTKVLYNFDDLISHGITNDKELQEWSSKGEEVFYWRLNPWFEVHHEEDEEFFSDAFHELNDAIEWAKYAKENPQEVGIE